MPSPVPVIGTTLVSVTESIDGCSTDIHYSSEPTLTLSSTPGDLGCVVITSETTNDVWIYADTLTIKNRIWLPGKHIKIVVRHISFAQGASLNVDGRAGKNDFLDRDQPRPFIISDTGGDGAPGSVTETTKYMVGTIPVVVKSGDGTEGKFTEDGAYARDGANGEDGGRIELYFDTHDGSLDLNACGGAGARGEAGRSGAPGGNGGAGDAKQIFAVLASGSSEVANFSAPPGKPGKGGIATAGGKGGDGGKGGTIIVQTLAQPRPIVQKNTPGSNGGNGAAGMPGDGGTSPRLLFRSNSGTVDVPEQHGERGGLRTNPRGRTTDPNDGGKGPETVNANCAALEFLKQCSVVHLGMIWERIQGVALMLDTGTSTFSIGTSAVGSQTLWLNGILKHLKPGDFDTTTEALLDTLRRDVADFVSNMSRHRDVFGNEQDWVPAASTYVTNKFIDTLQPQLKRLEDTYTAALKDRTNATKAAAAAKDAFAQLGAGKTWLTTRVASLTKDVDRSFEAITKADVIARARAQDFQVKGAKPLSDAISAKFELDAAAFLSALTNMAFSPPFEPSRKEGGKTIPGGVSGAGLAMAGISLAQALQESSKTIVDQTTGQRIEKSYLITQVRDVTGDIVSSLKSVSQGADGLLEDGTRVAIQVSAEQVQKLVATVCDLPAAHEYLREFHAFMDAAIARSDAIVQYNSYVLDFLQAQLQLQEVTSSLQDELSKPQDSTYMLRERQLAWTALTYQRLRKTCLQQICSLNQAYRLWSLEEYNVFATVLDPNRNVMAQNMGGEITATMIDQCRVELEGKYFASIQQNYDSDRYKKLPDRLGDALRITAKDQPDLIERFKKTGEISFILRPTDKNGVMLDLLDSRVNQSASDIALGVIVNKGVEKKTLTKGDFLFSLDAFTNRSFNRLLLVRPFLVGVELKKAALLAATQGSVDYFEIDAVHGSEDWFQNSKGNLFRYRHPLPRTFTFSYYPVPPFKEGPEQYLYNPGFFADEAEGSGAAMAMSTIDRMYKSDVTDVMLDGQEYVGIGPFGSWTIRLRTDSKFVLLGNLSEIVIDFHTSAYKL